MVKFAHFLALLVVTALISSHVRASNTADAQLYTLLDEIWQYELSVSPTLASREGVNKYNDQLADISPQALADEHKQWQRYASELAQYETKTLSTDATISLLMQQYRLNNYIDNYRFRSYLVPINSEYGFHASMASLPKIVSFKDVTDYRDYLSRLTALSGYFEQQMAYMQEAIDTGFTQPKVVLQGFEETVLPYISDEAASSPFYSPFEQFPGHLTSEQKTALMADAKRVINEHVTPSYQAFYDFLVAQYIPAARESIAATAWPDGEAFYKNRVEHYTTTDMSPNAIHKLGLSEVARIRTQMQAIIDELAFDGDIDDFIHFLRTDPQFYADTPEELLKEASFIAKKMDARLPQLFERLPRTPYGVAPVPESIAPKYTTGRYIHPSRDDQPGYYWVNTYALDKRPLYALPALTLHEAVPGHHLQISLAAELDDLPKVRQNTYISAFGEGWGLYSEFLGIEAGMYEDPYDDFGRLSYEMWRACRLVVDTGMHSFGWTRQEALDYMLKNTALSEHNVTTEIDRYISWPAQALSYKIGEIKIKALRKKAEAALGKQFDVRKFHRAVLAHGSVPLFILEQQIDKYIQQTKDEQQ